MDKTQIIPCFERKVCLSHMQDVVGTSVDGSSFKHPIVRDTNKLRLLRISKEMITMFHSLKINKSNLLPDVDVMANGQF